MYQQLSNALLLAAKLHLDQSRDGENALPYIVHPVEVVSNLRYVGGVVDEEMLVAAALHDVVEESGFRLSRIEKQFGRRVRGLVAELTRREPTVAETEGLSAPEVWSLRSEILLSEIAAMSPDAQMIKLADRLSNLREAGRTKKGEKLVRYQGQSRRILEIVPESVNPGLWHSIASALRGDARRPE